MGTPSWLSRPPPASPPRSCPASVCQPTSTCTQVGRRPPRRMAASWGSSLQSAPSSDPRCRDQSVSETSGWPASATSMATATVILRLRAVGGQPDPGHVYVYLGSAQGLIGDPPAMTIDGTAPLSLGGVQSAGDLNGDGYGDFVVTQLATSSTPPALEVYLGTGDSNLARLATTLLSPNAAEPYFGASAVNAGDVNGDGYSDLLVGGLGAASNHAYVYLGSASANAPVPAMPSAIIAGDGAAFSYFGHGVTGAGDFNADGYGDIAISDYGNGQVFEVSWEPDGDRSFADSSLVLHHPAGVQSFGTEVDVVGDVNGDGTSLN